MMRCATCGERLDPDQTRCPTCGSVAVPRTTAPRSPVRWEDGGALAGVLRCPRCGYHGQGTSYFSRPGHLGLLIGVSLFSYGIGGLVYWLARRKHYVCPKCGLGWENAIRARPGDRDLEPMVPDHQPKLPSSGVKRRVLGSLMILLASFMIMMGIIEFEAIAVVIGSVAGAAGSGTFFWGWKALQERRQALSAGLQRKVIRLAGRRGGKLTVTDVAGALSLSLPAAENVLISMDDGFRVRSEITDEGVIVYEFPELIHRDRLESGGESAGA